MSLPVIDRRTFLRRSVGIGVSMAVLPIIGSSTLAFAQTELKPVDLASPVAQALGYVHDAKTVDKVKFSRYQDGQTCKGCQYFSAGGQKVPNNEGSWGKCTIFPQNLVNENGWCNTFVLKSA